MGYNVRNDEIRDNVTRMRREWEAQRGAVAAVRRFNAILSAKGYVWFWPKITAALTSKYHWLIINCDSCGTVVDLDLRVKPRDPEASVRIALRDVQCPRCNGHGTTHHCVGATPVDLVSRRLLRLRLKRKLVTRNCLSGALLGIYNSDYHDGKSLFYRRSGFCRRFFSIERSFDLSVHPQEEPFIDGPCLTLWRA